MNKGLEELEQVAEQYRRDGYEVILRPRGLELPAFLGTFEPDLIARSKNENVVVEVKVGPDLASDHQLGYLAALVNSQPGWRFDFVAANHRPWPDEVAREAAEPTSSEIRSLARNAEELASIHAWEAAYLVAWSATEAAMRAAARRESIPLETKDPRFVLKTLYSRGVLSREDYEQLEEAMRVRNSIAHGLRFAHLPLQPPAFLIQVAERLLDDAAPSTTHKRRRTVSSG